MARQIIVSQFHEYGTAHRAFVELVQSGIASGNICIVAGDRSDRQGASRDFGILKGNIEAYRAVVRRGITLLAVASDDSQTTRVRRIIGQYAPISIESSTFRTGSATLSGAPADHAASPGELPQSRSSSRSLVREEGELASDVDPDKENRERPRRNG